MFKCYIPFGSNSCYNMGSAMIKVISQAYLFLTKTTLYYVIKLHHNMVFHFTIEE